MFQLLKSLLVISIAISMIAIAVYGFVDMYDNHHFNSADIILSLMMMKGFSTWLMKD